MPAGRRFTQDMVAQIANVNGSVLTFSFLYQTGDFVLQGLPNWTIDGGNPVSAAAVTGPTLVEVTFANPIAPTFTLDIPPNGTALRTSTGAFVAPSRIVQTTPFPGTWTWVTASAALTDSVTATSSGAPGDVYSLPVTPSPGDSRIFGNTTPGNDAEVVDGALDPVQTVPAGKWYRFYWTGSTWQITPLN